MHTEPHPIPEAEWTTRVELAALYRLVAHFGMTDMIDTHITARVPGPEHHFLINRYGVLFHEMRASDLVRIDAEGRVVEPAAANGDGDPARPRGERLIRDLGPHSAMILRNHGLLAAGRSVAAAFQNIYFLERACQIQVRALAGNAELILPPEAVRRLTAEQFDRDEADAIIALQWQAALRLIEGGATDYRS